MNLSPYLDLRINQELDRNLIPCPVCHNEYNDPHKHRKGPTCVDKFEGDKVHIICLNCWTIGEEASNQIDANDHWNNGELARDKSEKPQLRKLREAKGLTKGVWDIFVPVAVNDKAGMYIEMKFGKGRLTKEQKQFREAVGEAYAWSVCYTAEEAARVIGEYLGIDELIKIESY